MTFHFPFPPQLAADERARLRAEVCNIIDRAIDLLDRIDGDADLEADWVLIRHDAATGRLVTVASSSDDEDPDGELEAEPEDGDGFEWSGEGAHRFSGVSQ